MKLLIIIDDLFSAGTENVLASRLLNVSKDFQVYIVSLYARGPIADFIETLGFNVEFIDMERLGYLRGVRTVKKIIQRENPDLALCMRDVSRGLFPWFLKKQLPVVMFWDNPIIKRSFRQSIAEWFQVKFANSHMYCCSNATKVALKQVYGPKEIFVLSNCYDDRKFNAELNYDLATPVKIISVGSMREEKKHTDKIIIASRLKERALKFKMVIIGQGDSQELQAMIDDGGLQEEVSLLGEKNNVHQYLRNSQIFLFTSKSEGFPVSLLEAMASGLPCVTYQFPGLEEIDENFSNLEVVAQEDIDTAAEKIIYFAEKPEECKKLGEKAAKHVAKFFSAAENTKKWEKYLLSLI